MPSRVEKFEYNKVSHRNQETPRRNFLRLGAEAIASGMAGSVAGRNLDSAITASMGVGILLSKLIEDRINIAVIAGAALVGGGIKITTNPESSKDSFIIKIAKDTTSSAQQKHVIRPISGSGNTQK